MKIYIFQVYKLHLCGGQPGADLAPGLKPGPLFSPAYPGGYWICPHQSRGCPQDRTAQPPGKP